MSPINSARSFVFDTLFDIAGKSQFARSLDKFITWLIIANLAALVIEHIPALYATHEASLSLFDRISIYVFTLEYVLRLFSAGGDPRYQGKRFATMRFAATPFALIDLLVIAPYWLHLLGILNLDLRLLRVLRLLRLLKLLRDIVPAAQACSLDFVNGSVGKSHAFVSAPNFSTAARDTASATTKSVFSGKCGPCCSIAPNGKTTIDSLESSADNCNAERSPSNREEAMHQTYLSA